MATSRVLLEVFSVVSRLILAWGIGFDVVRTADSIAAIARGFSGEISFSENICDRPVEKPSRQPTQHPLELYKEPNAMKRNTLLALTAAIAAVTFSPAFAAAYPVDGLGAGTTEKVDFDRLRQANLDKVDFDKLRQANLDKADQI
jgi:hypothetical protein